MVFHIVEQSFLFCDTKQHFDDYMSFRRRTTYVYFIVSATSGIRTGSKCRIFSLCSVSFVSCAFFFYSVPEITPLSPIEMFWCLLRRREGEKTDTELLQESWHHTCRHSSSGLYIPDFQPFYLLDQYCTTPFKTRSYISSPFLLSDTAM